MRSVTATAWTAGLLCLLSGINASAEGPVNNANVFVQPTDNILVQQTAQQFADPNVAPVADPNIPQYAATGPGCVAGNCAQENVFTTNPNYIDNSCCDSGGCGYLASPFAGVEATFLRPDIRGGASSATVNGVEVGGKQAEGFYAAPRIWGGFAIGDSPLFARLQYWDLNASDITSAPATVFGSSIATLRARAFDFELGTQYCVDATKTNAWFTFGGRNVRWDQSSSAFLALLPDPTSSVFASATGLSEFNGTGITTSGRINHPIGCSNWSLFAGSRFSYLWGNQSSSAVSSASANVLGANAAGLNAAISDADATVWIAEAQAGTQWQRRLECINSNIFLRIALEYQYWHGNNDTQATAGSFAVAAPPLTSGSALAGNGPLGMTLLGFAVAAGLNF